MSAVSIQSQINSMLCEVDPTKRYSAAVNLLSMCGCERAWVIDCNNNANDTVRDLTSIAYRVASRRLIMLRELDAILEESLNEVDNEYSDNVSRI